jgi:hypothetical protein
MGAMTGRAAGYCAGYGAPGYANFAPGRGFGMGFGLGRRFWGRRFGGYGWRYRFFATGLPGWMPFGGYAAPYQKPDPELEKQALKNQAEALQSELDLIKKRLDELEAGASSE